MAFYIAELAIIYGNLWTGYNSESLPDCKQIRNIKYATDVINE